MFKKLIFVLAFSLFISIAHAVDCTYGGSDTSCENLSVGSACSTAGKVGFCVSTYTYQNGVAECSCKLTNSGSTYSTTSTSLKCTYGGSDSACQFLSVGTVCDRGSRAGVCVSQHTYQNGEAECVCR